MIQDRLCKNIEKCGNTVRQSEVKYTTKFCLNRDLEERNHKNEIEIEITY